VADHRSSTLSRPQEKPAPPARDLTTRLLFGAGQQPRPEIEADSELVSALREAANRDVPLRKALRQAARCRTRARTLKKAMSVLRRTILDAGLKPSETDLDDVLQAVRARHAACVRVAEQFQAIARLKKQVQWGPAVVQAVQSAIEKLRSDDEEKKTSAEHEVGEACIAAGLLKKDLGFPKATIARPQNRDVYLVSSAVRRRLSRAQRLVGSQPFDDQGLADLVNLSLSDERHLAEFGEGMAIEFRLVDREGVWNRRIERAKAIGGRRSRPE
jgi:hypothetical protein